MVSQAQIRQAQPRQRSLQQRLQRQKRQPVVSTYQKEQTKAEQKVQELKNQQQSAEYQKAVKDVGEWEQAIRIVTKGSRYDSRSSVGRKIKKIYESGGKEAIYGSASVYSQAKQKVTELQDKFTQFDSLGKGMSVKPKEEFDVAKYATPFALPSTPKVQPISILSKQPVSKIPTITSIKTGTREVDGQTYQQYTDLKTGQSFITEQVRAKAPTISQEIKRYKDLGYSKSDSSKLAKESVRQGGVSYTKERAKEITKLKLIADKDVIKERVKYVASAPAKTALFFSKEVGEISAKGTEKYYKSKGLEPEDIATPSYKTKITQEQYGTITDYESPFFKKVEVEIPAVKVKEKIELAKKVGKIGTMGAIYLTPYVGATVFASQVEGEIRPYDYNPITFAKEKPLEALMIGGAVVTYGAFKGTQFLKAPRVIKEGEDILRISTRGKELFGKRIRVSGSGKTSLLGDKGTGAFDKKIRFEVKPSTKGITIKREVIQKVKGDFKAPETKGLDILETTKEGTKEVILYKPQTLLQEGEIGRRVIVTKNGKLIYEGLPYGKLGQEARKKVLKTLDKTGYTKKQAQQLLKYQAPKTITQELKGGLKITKKAEGQFESVIKQPVIDLGGGIKTRGAKPIKTEITIERETVKIGGKDIVREVKGTQTFIKKKSRDGIKIIEEKEVSLGRIASKKPQELTSFDITGKTKEGVILVEEFPAQRIVSVSKETPILPSKPEIRLDISQTLLLKKTIEKVDGIGFMGGGKPSSKEYLQQLYAKQELKVAPKIAPPKISKTPKTTLDIPIPTQQELPYMVGGTGLSKPTYAGTGLYETMESSAIPSTSVSPITSYAMLDTKQVDVPVTTLDMPSRVETIQEPQLKLVQEPRLKTISESQLKVLQEPRLKIDSKQKIIQESKLKIIQEPILKQEPQLRQKQELIQEQILRQRLKQPQKTRPRPIEPTIKIPIIPLPSSLAKRLAKKVEENGFEAFGFRFGKEVSLGKAKTQKVAETTLSKFLRGTLSASGYISKGERKLKASELRTFGGGEFRVGKRSKFLVVEKKEKRLRKSGTGFQIQPFRFGGSSKKSKFGI